MAEKATGKLLGMAHGSVEVLLVLLDDLMFFGDFSSEKFVRRKLTKRNY